MKGLFTDKLGITFDSKETVLELNGCSIEAYPSNHIDAIQVANKPEVHITRRRGLYAQVSTG